MDYLAFGLLAGSLIVIASFAVRDGGLHLAAIREDSRLARWSRADVPIAWSRWCADLGLALSAAGTLVLLTTVATLLAGIADGAANLIVGVSVALALVGSALAAARLTQRLGVESEAELAGELPLAAAAVPSMGTTSAAPPAPAPAVAAPVTAEGGHVSTPTALPDPRSLWDDDLPAWRPNEGDGVATGMVAPTVSTAPAPGSRDSPAPPRRAGEWADVAASQSVAGPPSSSETQDARDEPVAEPWVDGPAGGAGYFSSPLLADIGVAPDDGTPKTAFRSSLLSDLFESTDSAEDTVESAVGDLGEDPTDTLIDETPMPLQAAARSRAESDIR